MSELSSSVVGPLSFSQKCSAPIPENPLSPISIPCLFCDKCFTFYEKKQEYLTHLYLKHRLIIGDEDEVAIFHEYLTYWREVFAGEDKRITEYCTHMVMDQLPDGTPSKNEKYFLLCDVLPQDNELRQKLRRRRLELALKQHQFERTDTSFERNCLFCREIIKTTRSNFIEHLFSKHFMHLGKPENLVFIDELIDNVQAKLENLICLYCEKIFKDRPTLKEHMRKKGHKRINPDNKNYDRFFLIHYKNPSNVLSNHQQRRNTQLKIHDHKNFKIANDHSNSVFEHDSDSNWSDWESESDEQDIICLYCTEKNNDFTKLKDHIKLEHGIDFDHETKKMTFYEQIKIVNFVRRKMYTLQCITCDEHFQNSSNLQDHLRAANHYSLGNIKDWNLPQYYFPTYEDDAFLCQLDGNLDDDSCTAVTESKIIVYSEDRTLVVNLDAEALSKEQLNIVTTEYQVKHNSKTSSSLQSTTGKT